TLPVWRQRFRTPPHASHRQRRVPEVTLADGLGSAGDGAWLPGLRPHPPAGQGAKNDSADGLVHRREPNQLQHPSPAPPPRRTPDGGRSARAISAQGWPARMRLKAWGGIVRAPTLVSEALTMPWRNHPSPIARRCPCGASRPPALRLSTTGSSSGSTPARSASQNSRGHELLGSGLS